MLALVGGGVILVGLLGLGFAWHRGWLGKAIRGTKLMYEGTDAPGAREVKALGCDTASVINSDDLGDLVGKSGPHDEKFVVVCVARGAGSPSCDDVAAAYVKAVGEAPGPFVVSVRRTDGTADHCTERYDDDGTKR